MRKFTIVGGGIAGLCAAIRLTELGEEPLLIEGGAYPAHKVCGEFLSPECISYLHNWNIYPQSISKAVMQTSNAHHVFSFPTPAGGMSHMKLDPSLVNYARKFGAIIQTNTQVKGIQPKQRHSDPHVIHLGNGEVIETANIIIAMGRIPSYSINPPLIRYMGFKAHFKNILSERNLEMFSFSGGYLGIAPIEENQYNVACLATVEVVKKYGHPHLFMENIIAKHSFLHTCLLKENSLFGEWMIAPIPAFGLKQTPDWLDAYFIGDAAVTIPPACGNGLAMAIIGGRLAAEHAICSEDQKFKKMWKNRCSSQVLWAKFLHRLLSNPSYGSKFLKVGNFFPYFSRKIYDLTRHTTTK